MVTWAKFRLPSAFGGIAQKQNARSRGGGLGGVLVLIKYGGGGCLLSLFFPRETRKRRLVGISTHISRRQNFAKYVTTKKEGETKTKQLRKIIRIIFDQSMVLPNFLGAT
jgi:hypothetical protein